MSDVVISVENLSKRFHLGTSGGPGYHRLSEALAGLPRYAWNAFRRPAHTHSTSPTAERARSTSGEDSPPDASPSSLQPPSSYLQPPASSLQPVFWALKDVSFEIAQGEVVGIIGRNGAGKSTLLKILSRITEPTSGRFGVRGRVASLLEVGTGFHPELTGRENIFISGITLGMTRAEVKRRFDEIVDFSGVEKFLDTPVKRYSSGMQVRLGFAVAAHLESEILIVDEVLAVGDAEFQKKCLGRMSEVASGGRTVLFVSHNIHAIRSLCSSGVWISGGSVMQTGDCDSVASNYMDALMSGTGSETFRGQDFDIERVVLKDGHGDVCKEFYCGDAICVEVHYNAHRPIQQPHFYVSFRSQFGGLFGGNMLLDGNCPDQISGRGVLGCTFPSIPLLPQRYSVGIGVRRIQGEYTVATLDPAAEFSVIGSPLHYDLRGELAERFMPNSNPLMIPYYWTLPDGETHFVDPTRASRQAKESD